jgi:hypothetical protein
LQNIVFCYCLVSRTFHAELRRTGPTESFGAMQGTEAETAANLQRKSRDGDQARPVCYRVRGDIDTVPRTGMDSNLYLPYSLGTVQAPIIEGVFAVQTGFYSACSDRSNTVRVRSTRRISSMGAR